MAAASDNRKDRDADHVHRKRWKDLHEPHTTLRPWLPQPIVMSPLPRARSWLPRLNTRVMGIETEYGISALAPGSHAVPSGFGNAFVEDDLHPMQLSNHVVKAYGASAPGQPAGWDYETETPLRDIRGYEISRAAAHPDQLTDTDLGMANVILTNGRGCCTSTHPEYSSPEVTCASMRCATTKLARPSWRSPRSAPHSHARSGSTRTTQTARVPRTAPTRTTCCSAAHPSTGLSRSSPPLSRGR